MDEVKYEQQTQQWAKIQTSGVQIERKRRLGLYSKIRGQVKEANIINDGGNDMKCAVRCIKSLLSKENARILKRIETTVTNLTSIKRVLKIFGEHNVLILDNDRRFKQYVDTGRNISYAIWITRENDTGLKHAVLLQIEQMTGLQTEEVTVAEFDSQTLQQTIPNIRKKFIAKP